MSIVNCGLVWNETLTINRKVSLQRRLWKSELAQCVSQTFRDQILRFLQPSCLSRYMQYVVIAGVLEMADKLRLEIRTCTRTCSWFRQLNFRTECGDIDRFHVKLVAEDFRLLLCSQRVAAMSTYCCRLATHDHQRSVKRCVAFLTTVGIK